MKNVFLFLILANFSVVIKAQIQYGTWRTTQENVDYHHFVRNGGGAAVYINQVSTSAAHPILRLSSGSSAANQNVRLTVANNGYVGIGVIEPSQQLEVNGTTLSNTFRTSENNIDYHHFTRDGGGAAVYINQINPNYPILRLSSGTFNANQNVRFTVENNGNVGIGTTTPDAKLAVRGDIHTQEVRVDLNGAVAPDFVFEPDYKLRTLAETETYIKANKHLPEIPSAAEMEQNGMELKTMNLKLLQKIEELTLYIIEQNKQNETQQEQIQLLQKQVNELRQPKN